MGSPVVERVASLLTETVTAGSPLFAQLPSLPASVFWVVGLVVLVIVACEVAGVRYIGNNRVGIVEKLWSIKGSVPEGRIIACSFTEESSRVVATG